MARIRQLALVFPCRAPVPGRADLIPLLSARYPPGPFFPEGSIHPELAAVLAAGVEHCTA